MILGIWVGCYFCCKGATIFKKRGVIAPFGGTIGQSVKYFREKKELWWGRNLGGGKKRMDLVDSDRRKKKKKCPPRCQFLAHTGALSVLSDKGDRSKKKTQGPARLIKMAVKANPTNVSKDKPSRLVFGASSIYLVIEKKSALETGEVAGVRTEGRALDLRRSYGSAPS